MNTLDTHIGPESDERYSMQEEYIIHQNVKPVYGHIEMALGRERSTQLSF